MYDAELFGHWWFEGVVFLEAVFRRLAGGAGVEPALPGEAVRLCRGLQTVAPSASSWGDKGYFEQWLNDTNDWIYPLLHECEDAMARLAREFAGGGAPDPLTRRALDQAARELMLAQSSDWAFQMSTGAAREYASARTRTHVERFRQLAAQIATGEVDAAALGEIERRDAAFEEMDYTIYAGR